ncbi:hypothetical protein RD792_016691 [Penstemon davidsonii]|uniref:Uncharacterized protein n=1 Tax=Penstemon davidsonii TaxID=160366 RepID=A0ABR0CK17_9LAMI|nr:hypothetical protein RD792_016688 [Penstemon davidsonii]KAK4477468.1 hypothetical protein RD792_016691 [Penstemon davidsonii]
MVSSSKEESASDSENSSGDAPESKSKSLFSAGEKVLAYHGPRIYEAKACPYIYFSLGVFLFDLSVFCVCKVQKAEFRKNEWRYFVHYLVSDHHIF